MKIITCASFNGSGSSAVTDLIGEYSNVQQATNYEYRFIHDPDGIMDLEYHLVHNHNRENSGHALKKFERFSSFNAKKIHSLYEKTFNNKYISLTDSYIKSLTDFSYKGWWFFDLYDMGIKKYHRMQAKNHLLRKLGLYNSFMKDSKIYCSHPSEDKFLAETKKYVHNLVKEANSQNKEYVEFDQLVPSQNISKALRYFSDPVFVVVVDRDPRDIYATYKYVYKEGPTRFENASDFCKWFKYLMESGCKEDWQNSENVLHIHFEDLIYNYNKTVKKIEAFTGLKAVDHKNAFSRLNPLRSVHNTQIYKKYCCKEDIKKIEKELAKYLFDFDKVKENKIEGIAVSDTTVF